MKHDELQRDLARSRIGVGEAVVEKLSLGPWGAAGQMDVWTMRLSRSKPRPTCYEVKVSRADFLADVRASKHRRYEPFVERCYFAAPSGMVDKREVPEGWGLIVRGDNGWHSLKAPRRLTIDPGRWRGLMMAVVLSLHPGPWQEPDRQRRILSITAESGDLNEYRALGGDFGRQVEAIVREASEARRSREDAEDTIKAIGDELGVSLRAGMGDWQIRRLLREAAVTGFGGAA